MILQKLNSICIYGMGLMGTSLAYSLKEELDFKGKIIGVVRSQKSKEWILKKKLADKVFTSDESRLKAAIMSSDFVIIGLPVLDTLSVLKQLIQWNYSGFVTDMSSTRWELENRIRKWEKKTGTTLKFVGSHPMCGSEASGPEGFVKRLYRDKLCIIIDRLESDLMQIDRDKEVLKNIIDFWESVGMKVYLMDAKNHDYITAYLSHTPHVISSILTIIIGKKDFILKKNQEAPIPILGGGLKDMIRIAGSNPRMWYDILKTNHRNILLSLKEFRYELDRVIENIEKNSFPDTNQLENWWFPWQTLAKEKRDKIYGNQS